MTTAPASASHQDAPDFARFAIGFDHRDRARLHALIDEVLDSNRWSEADLNARFEAAWEAYNAAPAVALCSWAGGAMAALHFAGVQGETVLCPSNTFMATPLAAIRAGAQVQFVDCNRDDLCMSFADFQRAAEQHRPRAAFVVHIGGHIAFEVEQIAAYCAENGIFLIEDCAHAHGAAWHGRRPGTWGMPASTRSTPPRRSPPARAACSSPAAPRSSRTRATSATTASPSYEVPGLNFRMSEFTAALGLVQIERLPEIVAWKNETAREFLDPQYPGRLELPEGMVSGLYKYIVFDWLERSTGRVYDEPCHRIMGHDIDLPNSDWVARNHSCPPLYYRPVG